MENQELSVYKIITMSPYEAHMAMINEIEKEQPNLDVVKTILTESLIDVNSKDSGKSILAYSLSRQSFEIMNEILNHPDININSESDNGDSAFVIAVKNNNIDVIDLLMQKPNVDVNYECESGKTPLIIAVRSSRRDIVNKLLNHPDIDINYQNKWGMNALMWASRESNVDMLQILSQDSRIDITLKNTREHTAWDMLDTIKETGQNLKELFSNLDPNKNVIDEIH